MNRRNGRVGTIAFSGLTPLVDTLFLLLFALLTLSDARTANRTELVHVQLPEVEPAGEVLGTGSSALLIEIDADSKVRLQPGQIEVKEREELDRALAAALGEAVPEEVLVEIQADRDARHGVAVELLQHLRLRGFVEIRLVAVGEEGVEGPFGGG